MAWPNLEETECPWCERIIAHPRLHRLHDNGVEFKCPFCARTHVRKENDPGLYAFFAGDIYAAFVDGTPWTLGGFES